MCLLPLNCALKNDRITVMLNIDTNLDIFYQNKKVFLLVKDTVKKNLKGKPPNKKIFVLHTYI